MNKQELETMRDEVKDVQKSFLGIEQYIIEKLKDPIEGARMMHKWDWIMTLSSAELDEYIKSG